MIVSFSQDGAQGAGSVPTSPLVAAENSLFIEGKRNIQGFFLAYLNLNYYYTAPEVEVAHGYCDFFLLPNLTHYQANHSYIPELKYLSKKDYTEEAAEQQWQEDV